MSGGGAVADAGEPGKARGARSNTAGAGDAAAVALLAGGGGGGGGVGGGAGAAAATTPGAGFVACDTTFADLVGKATLSPIVADGIKVVLAADPVWRWVD
jgi:hypothetical protein